MQFVVKGSSTCNVAHDTTISFPVSLLVRHSHHSPHFRTWHAAFSKVMCSLMILFCFACLSCFTSKDSDPFVLACESCLDGVSQLVATRGETSPNRILRYARRHYCAEEREGIMEGASVLKVSARENKETDERTSEKINSAGRRKLKPNKTPFVALPLTENGNGRRRRNCSHGGGGDRGHLTTHDGMMRFIIYMCHT